MQANNEVSLDNNNQTAWDRMQSNAHVGTRAMIELMHQQRLPVSYESDVAIDIDMLYQYGPNCFVVVLRENGSDIGIAALPWSVERVGCFGKEGGARVFCVEIGNFDKFSPTQRSYKIERMGVPYALEWLKRKAQQHTDPQAIGEEA